MSVRFMLVGCVLVLAVSSAADAACASKDWVGTPSGSRVPTHGTLYLSDGGRYLHGAAVPAHWIGATGSLTPVRVSDRIVAVSYAGPSGATLEIGHDQFLLEDAWRAPAAAPRAVGFRHKVLETACSREDSLTVVLDQTSAAIRVRWTFDGETSERIVVAGGAPQVDVELGKIYCGDTIVSPDELSDGGHLELRAIRLDGSEVDVQDLPPTMTSEPLLDEAMRGRVHFPLPYPLPLGIDTALLPISVGIAALAFARRRQRSLDSRSRPD